MPKDPNNDIGTTSSIATWILIATVIAFVVAINITPVIIPPPEQLEVTTPSPADTVVLGVLSPDWALYVLTIGVTGLAILWWYTHKQYMDKKKNRIGRKYEEAHLNLDN